MKKKNIFLGAFLSLVIKISIATEVKEFENFNSTNTEEVSIAFMDLSTFSLQWLTENYEYLIANEIPLVVDDGDEQKIYRLNKIYEGLLAGQFPKPREYTTMMLQHLGINAFPAVYENGVVWQKNPNVQK